MKIFKTLWSLTLMAFATIAALLPIGAIASAASRVWEAISVPRSVPYATLGANTLTGLIPTLYEAMNIVSREMVGFIPAVMRDVNVAERAALNQVVRSPIAPPATLEDITPGATPANSGDQTLDYYDVTITKSKAAPVRWNGEEQKAVGTTGTFNRILADQFAEAMRAIVNAMELDLAVCAKQNSSRAVGTAGATPFGTANDLSDFSQPLKVLEDNGAPKSDLQFVANSASMANLRGKQAVLFRVNEAGSSDMLRNGMTDRVMGFALRNSAGLTLHTKGTGASYVTSGSTAVGVKSIALITGTGTVLAGDVVTFVADSANKYVVNAGVAAPGTITIGKPGALVTIPTSNAMTIGNSYTPNIAFARTALLLAQRAPALPQGGDSADDAMMITDPVTGLTFEVRVYRQYRQVKFEICSAWGVAAPNGAHIVTLMG